MTYQSSMYQESLRAFLKPIVKYLDDEAVTEIMVNAHDEVWIEKGGKLILTDAKFTPDGLEGAARNIAQFVGRVLSDERPRLDARLPDGSRIHVILPPVARRGATLCIRKFFRGRLGIKKLIELHTLTPQMARLIQAMVQARLNIIVSGGTSSGKTTLLNVFSSLIPPEERLVTIEDSAELQLRRQHLISLESRLPDKLGKGEVDMAQLLDSALRLRPDRIIVGEVRGGEAMSLIQALNTGHGGSLATIHANSPTDTLRRFETLCLMSGVEIPLIAVRAQVASAVHAIVTCERTADGARRVTAISEVLPLDERGEYRAQDLFVFAPTHRDVTGRMRGFFAPTGLLPTFMGKLKAEGYHDVDERFFDPATYGLPPPPSRFLEKLSVRWAPSLKHRERGEPDPREIQQQLQRSAEIAMQADEEHRRQLEAGTLLDAYEFPDAEEPAEAPIEARPSAPRPTPPPRPAERESATAEAIPTLPEPRDSRTAPTGRTVVTGRAGALRPAPSGPSVEVDDSLLDGVVQTGAEPGPGARLPPGKRPLPQRPSRASREEESTDTGDPRSDRYRR